MTTHTARIEWARGDSLFSDRQYSRVHHWRFDGGAVVEASASPQRVKAPLSSARAVDPEEAFIASISSCHMLWFLDFAAQRGLIIDSYVDDAYGTLAADDAGRWSMTSVVLRPKVTGAGVTREALEALHHQAHEACFLARSVTAKVTVET